MPHSKLVRDWTSRDLSLAMADLLARDDIGACGLPHSETTKHDADRYDVHTSVCGACAAMAKHQDGHKPAPGTLLSVTDRLAGTGVDEPDEFGPQFD